MQTHSIMQANAKLMRSDEHGYPSDGRPQAVVSQRGQSVVSDGDKLRIILSNLVSHAVEYTEPGAVESSRVTTTLASRSRCGIVGRRLRTACCRESSIAFFAADAARSGVHCGIGLAIARNLSSLLGLTLTAHNSRNGSVSFRLERAAAKDAKRVRSHLSTHRMPSIMRTPEPMRNTSTHR